MGKKRHLPYQPKDKSPTSRRAYSTRLKLALKKLGLELTRLGLALTRPWLALTSPKLLFSNRRAVKNTPGLVEPNRQRLVVNFTGAYSSKKTPWKQPYQPFTPLLYIRNFFPWKTIHPFTQCHFMTDFQAFRCEHLGFPSLHTIHAWHPRPHPMRWRVWRLERPKYSHSKPLIFSRLDALCEGMNLFFGK